MAREARLSRLLPVDPPLGATERAALNRQMGEIEEALHRLQAGDLPLVQARIAFRGDAGRVAGPAGSVHLDLGPEILAAALRHRREVLSGLLRQGECSSAGLSLRLEEAR